ncbi:MAG: cobalamin B12-binding domain-containing protein [Candidatus Heimdallarchaeota archaeon]
MAKTGTDIHDRGAKVVSLALRDAGVEVIYVGLFRTPEEIIEAAIQEDADCIGISILDGTHMTYIPKIMQKAKERGIYDRLFIVGGAITSNKEIKMLKQLGVAEIFGPGTPPKQIVGYILNFFEKMSIESTD